MTPQQAREKLAELLREQDELTAAIGKTGVRFAVKHRFIEWVKQYYLEVMYPLMEIAAKDQDKN